MRGFRFLHLAMAVLLATAMLESLSFGQYWFQTGANAGSQAVYNNGAGAYIQTIEPQNVKWGALGFWVGETLQNGAFLQVGYEVPNATGKYPSYCDASGCNGSVLLTAGYPAWFWEYFPAGYSGTAFYGGVGPNGSAGANGTFNEYSFSSSGDTWNVYFNDRLVGSANLGTSTSGQYAPSAYAELANTNNTGTFMKTVLFKNLSYLKNGVSRLLQSGTSYIGYGTGSLTNLKNPYGVKEVNSYANYFAVGSGVPATQNDTSLWTSVYRLQIDSQFGNVIGTGYYPTFSNVNFSIQKYVYITSVERVVFAGWQGSGGGSYSGFSNTSTAHIVGNVTETALWDLQYYVNATSQFGSVSGSGWYAPNATARIALESSIVNISNGTRESFAKWSDGYNAANRTVVVSAPTSISARWQEQYLVSLNTGLGKASGAGWYDAGSTAYISLGSDYFNATNTTRVAFYSWSGLYNRSSASITVDSPIALAAIFKRQHLVRFVAKDSAYNPISASYFVVNGKDTPNSTMLFDGVPYKVTAVSYKGVLLPANITANVSSSVAMPVMLPVYNVQVQAVTLFKTPLNASVHLTFQNGTSYQTYLGRTGAVVLQDVPFGYVTGYAKYWLLQENFNADGGSQIALTFPTPIVAVPIILVVAAMMAYELFHRRRYRRMQQQG